MRKKKFVKMVRAKFPVVVDVDESGKPSVFVYEECDAHNWSKKREQETIDIAVSQSLEDGARVCKFFWVEVELPVPDLPKVATVKGKVSPI